MSTESIEIIIHVVHSEWDEVLGDESILRTTEDAAQIAAVNLYCYILDNVPKSKACSIVFAAKRVSSLGDV